MTAFSFLRISPDTEIVRDKDGDLSLIYNGLHYTGTDNVPPEVLANIILCITRDYGDTRLWPELARQLISARTNIEVQGVNRASPA